MIRIQEDAGADRFVANTQARQSAVTQWAYEHSNAQLEFQQADDIPDWRQPQAQSMAQFQRRLLGLRANVTEKNPTLQQVVRPQRDDSTIAPVRILPLPDR